MDRLIKRLFQRFNQCVAHLQKDSALLAQSVNPQMEKDIHSVLLVRESYRVIENFRMKNSRDILQAACEIEKDLVTI